MERTFNILSLNGGGARGVFQAVFLRELLRTNGDDFLNQFDLLAGTSTGSIVALSLGLGVSPSELVDAYNKHLSSVFDARTLGYVRRGPRYRQEPLRKLLEGTFGTKTLGDVSSLTAVRLTQKPLATSSCYAIS